MKKHVAGLAGLVLGANALAQPAQDLQLQVEPLSFKYTTPQPQEPLPEKENPFALFVKNTLASRYHTTTGFIMSEGPVNQTLVSLSKPNVLMEGDVLDGYVWSNLDLKTGTLSEVDFGIDYTFPIAENVLGGKLTGYAELAHWEYPDGRLGDNDKTLIGKLTYDGPITASVKATQLLTSGRGRSYDFAVSKPFELFKNDDTSLTLTPIVSTAYLDDFYDFNGFSNVQAGADLSLKRGNLSLDAYIRQQEGLQEGFQDQTLFGIGVSFSF